MAAARPLDSHIPSAPAPTARQAEARWRAVVDAQRADLELLRARWPDRASAESRAAIARITLRAAAGGDADRAIAAVHEAYGGAARTPHAVRQRLERYAWDRLSFAPRGDS